MTDWSPQLARQTYSVPYWSEGYYDVDDGGRVVVRPRGDAGPSVALAEVVERARGNGAKLPLLVRFPDILGDRLRRLQGAFARAMDELDYAGGYNAVYPSKVTQRAGVAGVGAVEGTRGGPPKKAKGPPSQ